MSLIDWRKYDPKCSTCELYKKRAVPTASPAGYVSVSTLDARTAEWSLLVQEKEKEIERLKIDLAGKESAISAMKDDISYYKSISGF